LTLPWNSPMFRRVTSSSTLPGGNVYHFLRSMVIHQSEETIVKLARISIEGVEAVEVRNGIASVFLKCKTSEAGIANDHRKGVRFVWVDCEKGDPILNAGSYYVPLVALNGRVLYYITAYVSMMGEADVS
jgi:hypothetical protein